MISMMITLTHTQIYTFNNIKPSIHMGHMKLFQIYLFHLVVVYVNVCFYFVYRRNRLVFFEPIPMLNGEMLEVISREKESRSSSKNQNRPGDTQSEAKH